MSLTPFPSSLCRFLYTSYRRSPIPYPSRSHLIHRVREPSGPRFAGSHGVDGREGMEKGKERRMECRECSERNGMGRK